MSKKGDVHSILDMLVYIADENSKNRASKPTRTEALTAADLEKLEWNYLKARLQRRQKILGEDLVGEEDDDGDALLLIIDALAESKTPLTTFELMRKLQQARFLSYEFTAAAREQCKVMLTKLRVANRIWQDQHGRWSLL